VAPPPAVFETPDANTYGIEAALARIDALLCTDPVQASQELSALKALFARERGRYRDPAVLKAHQARMELLDAQVDVELSAPPPSCSQGPYPGL